MCNFKDDYSEGCHPSILKALMATNDVQQDGYGDDSYSIKAKELIQKELCCDQAAIHFVSGGTQANLIVISSLLRPYEAVIAAHTGHINIHEAGAIEATGHKVCTSFSKDGKLTVKQIAEVLAEHEDPPHMVKPKLVYISNATEVGSVYSAAELKELYTFCKAHNLLLFVDGARLATALVSEKNTLSLADMAKYTDVFYIGGTKNGALLGEAIVICNADLQADFAYNLKQKGALMAKGRVLGIQFLTLFQDGLFLELARHSNLMAKKLAEVIQKAGFQLLQEPVSNQVFAIFPNKVATIIQEKHKCHVWQRVNESEMALRMVCSWATQPKAINDFRKSLDSF